MRSNPSALSQFTAKDEGNATARYFRCTHQAIPETEGTIRGIYPFGAVVQPFAEAGNFEASIPLSNTAKTEIVRCLRCGAYPNPHCMSVPGHDNFRCNLCETVTPRGTPVLTHDADHLDPAFKFGICDFEAPQSLAGLKISAHNLVIVLDCLPQSAHSGLIPQTIASIKACLDSIPDPCHTNIALMTYSQGVTFYTAGGGEQEIAAIHMADVNTPFLPLPSSRLMLNLQSDRARLDTLLDRIANNLKAERGRTAKDVFGSAGGAAIKLAVEVAREGGRVLWLLGVVPSLGVGALKTRGNKELCHTDSEATLLKADSKDTFYSELGKRCLKSAVAVDVFACVLSSVDIATLSLVSSRVGGEIHYYAPFSATEHGARLHYDLSRCLTRFTVYDVAVKARSSLGLSVGRYVGGFGEHEGPVLQLSTLDCDKTIGFELKYDRKLKPDTAAYIQFAVLYTTGSGQRRIRTFNYALTITKDHRLVYRSIDLEAVVNLATKLAACSMLKTTLKIAKEQLCTGCINTLAHAAGYTKEELSQSLIVPTHLALYPLYILGTLKTPAFAAWEDTTIELKVASLLELSGCSLSHFLMAIYTRTYQVSQVLPEGPQKLKLQVKPSSFEKLTAGKAYVIATSEYIYLYVTNTMDSVDAQELLGVTSMQDFVQRSPIYEPTFQTKANYCLAAFFDTLRRAKGGPSQAIRILLPSSDTEKILRNILTEDSRNSKTEFTYLQFLAHIHKLIPSTV